MKPVTPTMMKPSLLLLAATLAGCLVFAQDPRVFAQDPENAREEWPSFGRDDAETRFSPLDQIDASNVAQLGLVWNLAGANSLPVMVGGVLYGTLDNAVYAADAKTGTVTWRWDASTRTGVALFESRVYAGLADGRVVALDAMTGKPLWAVEDRERPAREVRIVKDKLVVRSTRRITAYDAGTGAGLWWVEATTDTGSLAYDAEIDVLYGGSIAVKPDTGNCVWQAMGALREMLADLTIDGRLRRAIVQTGTDGTLRVLDRVTGALLQQRKPATGDGAPSWNAGIAYVPVESGLVAIGLEQNSEKWQTAGTGGAAMATAGGLVFFGNAAYDAATGARVWREVRLRDVAASMSYMLGGRQYVAMLGGGGLFVLTLDGEAAWP